MEPYLRMKHTQEYCQVEQNEVPSVMKSTEEEGTLYSRLIRNSSKELLAVFHLEVVVSIKLSKT